MTGGSHGSRSTHSECGDGTGIERRRHGRRSGRQVGDEAANEASEVMRQTKEQVRTVLDDTKQEIHTQAQRRGEQAAKALHSFSDQLSSLAEGRPEQAGQLPDYIRDAEGRVRDLATRLQSGDRRGSSPTSATSPAGAPAHSCWVRRAPAS